MWLFTCLYWEYQNKKDICDLNFWNPPRVNMPIKRLFFWQRIMFKFFTVALDFFATEPCLARSAFLPVLLCASPLQCVASIWSWAVSLTWTRKVGFLGERMIILIILIRGRESLHLCKTLAYGFLLVTAISKFSAFPISWLITCRTRV